MTTTTQWTITFHDLPTKKRATLRDKEGRIIWTESCERAERWQTSYDPTRADVHVVDADDLAANAREMYHNWPEDVTFEPSPLSEEAKELARARENLPHPRDLLDARSWLLAGAPSAHRDHDAPARVRTLLALIEELPYFIDLYCYGSPANRAAYEAHSREGDEDQKEN